MKAIRFRFIDHAQVCAQDTLADQVILRVCSLERELGLFKMLVCALRLYLPLTFFRAQLLLMVLSDSTQVELN